MSKIIMTGGGTAGHCTPNVALIPYLKKKTNKIYYVGSSDGIEKKIISKTDLPYYEIPCAKLKRSFAISNFKIPVTVYQGVKRSLKIIDEIKPDVVFSKGGYVSVPLIIAAHKRKIPVICHESDLSIGLANKICSRFSARVLTSFPETADKLKNGYYTGSPLRKGLLERKDKISAVKSFGFEGNRPVLLITGGSLGARAINQAVLACVDRLTENFDVIHVCGKGNLTKKTPRYFQAEFLDDIERAFCAADVCVSRAGSNTVFELLALKKPSLLIPLPKGASRGDQLDNAEYFKRKDMVNVLLQEDLTADTLVNAVSSTYEDRFKLTRRLSESPIEDASKKICDVIYQYLPD